MENRPLHIRPNLNLTFQVVAWPNSDNCYTYALDQKGTGLCVPGTLIKPLRGAYISKQFNRGVFHMYLERDGLRPIESKSLDPAKDHIIAAFWNLKGPLGFHFFRMDRDGTWSHKGGHGGIPANTDNNGNPIYDPNKAVHGWTGYLFGYYKIPDEGLFRLAQR